MRTSTAAALVLAAALGLAGCGGDADNGAPATPSAASSDDATIDGGTLATRLADAMVEAGSGTMTIELGSGRSATGSFVIHGDSVDQELSLPVQGRTMQLVVKDGVLYLKGVPRAAKPWVKVDPKASDLLSQIISGMVGDLGDPRELARALEGTSVKEVGTRGGVTEYTATIDPAKVFGSSALGPGAASMGTVETRYFVDAQDRPTRLEADLDGRTVVATFAGWGSPVAVQAPPADQVGGFPLRSG